MQIHLKPGESVVVVAGNEKMIIHAYYGLNSDFLENQPDPEPYQVFPWMKVENICLSVRHNVPEDHYVTHQNPHFLHSPRDSHGLASHVKEESK